MAPTDDNGWERWRGGVDSDVDAHTADISRLWQARNEDLRTIGVLERSMVEVKTKMAIIAFLAAAAGGFLSTIIAGFIHK